MNDTFNEPTEPDSEAKPPEQPVVRSEELMQGHKEILIRHGSETYRLRLTRSGKLILQK